MYGIVILRSGVWSATLLNPCTLVAVPHQESEDLIGGFGLHTGKGCRLQ